MDSVILDAVEKANGINRKSKRGIALWQEQEVVEDIRSILSVLEEKQASFSTYRNEFKYGMPLHEAVGKYYGSITSDIGLRTNHQCITKQPFDMEDALSGFTLTTHEQPILREFAEEAYAINSKYLKEWRDFEEGIKPYAKKAKYGVGALGALLMGGGAYALSKDAWFTTKMSALGLVLGYLIEAISSSLSLRLSGTKRPSAHVEVMPSFYKAMSKLDPTAKLYKGSPK